MALGIVSRALTIVHTYPKLGRLAKVSGVGLKLACATLYVGATRYNDGQRMRERKTFLTNLPYGVARWQKAGGNSDESTINHTFHAASKLW